MPKLIVTDKDSNSREFVIADTLTIGRNPGNDIQIAEEKASRTHCRIRRTRDSVLVEDLDSSNGTRVNGRKVRSHTLHHGDSITIGKTTIAFEEDKLAKDILDEIMPDEESQDPASEPTMLMAPSPKRAEPDPPSRKKEEESIGLTPIVPDKDLIGMTLGGYRVESRLGQGGMGTVYRARQISMDRDVALKVLRRELAEDRNFVKSFLREARVAGQCTHKSIIEIHDFGEEKGILYFSMELVEGQSLNDILKRDRTIPVERALGISEAIAEALIHAAKVNIVHRDIKPHNIMISLRNEVKLADLGLASRGGQPAEREKPNSIQGTPHYMAPEQIKKAPLDGRTDIYALGATLFQMLTGDVPFDNPDKMVVLTKQLMEPRPDPREKNPNVPAQVAKLVQRMMAIDPEQRPAHAVALLSEIKIIQNGLGPVANLHKEEQPNGHLAGLLSVVDVPETGKSPKAEKNSPKKKDPKPAVARDPVEARAPRKNTGSVGSDDVPIEANIKAIVQGVVAGVLFLIALVIAGRAIFSKEKIAPAAAVAVVQPAPEPADPEPALARQPVETVKTPLIAKSPVTPETAPAVALVPLTAALSEELNKTLAERDKALASLNFLKARSVIAAFLAAHPDGEAGARAKKELSDTATLIDSALDTELKDAEKDAARKKYRLAMQHCTGLISSDPSGKYGQAAKALLTKIDEATKPRFTEFQLKAAEQTKAGQFDKAGETLGKALDELGGTKWAAQISEAQLQILMANSLLKQLEAERAKKASENAVVPVKLASKKLEGKLVRMNGIAMEIESEGISLSVKLKDVDPADFVKILQKFNLADRHLELAYLWVLLDRKEAALAEVERALEDPPQAAAAAKLASAAGNLNLHVYDFSRWQQQTEWEAVSGSWSTTGDRYVLDSPEGGDTSLKTDAIGGPFPAKGARISFDFELIKPGANYFLAFEFGEEQRAISAIFSASGIVFNSNLDGAMSAKAPWTPGASHVELAIVNDTLAMSVNGKALDPIEIKGLANLKGTLTFRARETACAIDNVILRNVGK